MTITLHKGDLPAGLSFGTSVAVDTETMGLHPHRDRLCLVQLSSGDGNAHLVQIPQNNIKAPNLCALLTDPKVTKLFHFARFDLAALKLYLNIDCAPVYCTKIASRLSRTFTDRHGLRDVAKDLLDVEISKQQQSSDWGADTLTEEQMTYAAGDVLYLHAIRAKLDEMLVREGRDHLAASLFKALPARAEADLGGWADVDIFAH